MSNAFANNLSREKIKRLLAAVGSEATEDTTQIESTEYNWHQSYYFSADQLKKLDNFAKKVAQICTKKFALLYHSDFNVTITSTTQHFADEFLDQVSYKEQGDYYLAFGIDQEHPCGFISIPLQTAIILATQLLGCPESEKDSGRALSLSEKSLLLDVASSIIKALSDSYGSYDFQPAESIVRGQLPFVLDGTEELCKITFGIEKKGSENSFEAQLLILCDKLEPAAGKTTQTTEGLSSEDISKVILGQLYQMSVSITAQLASTVLTFEEIMSLQVDDILLLDKRIDEPIELIVEDQIVLHGRPAKSAGKYAVVITEPACNTA